MSYILDDQSDAATRPYLSNSFSLRVQKLQRALSARVLRAPDSRHPQAAACLWLQYSTMLNAFNVSLLQLSFNTSIA
jgi:hypothetical protein